MSVKERILHMILFEAIALITFIPISMFVTKQDGGLMAALGLAITVIAMAWNLAYNWGFDALFGEKRILRTFATRLLHGIGFEMGIVVMTFPLLMWVLNESFMQILIWDIGAVIFFFVFSVAFNWIYDHSRKRFIQSPELDTP